LKLGKRLQQLQTMAGTGYDHIWDCCCDHGYLGTALLEQPATGKVHFVDIVPELIEALDRQLQQFCPALPWQTHCLDVARLPLRQHPGRHLVIIAGVGGDLLIDFVTQLNQRYPDLPVDYLLCPVYHQFAVRQRLIKLNFRLLQERLIEDKGRCYEILKVAPARDDNQHLTAVSPVGESIWLADSEAQRRVVHQYHRNTLAHYRRISRGDQRSVTPILDAYSALLLDEPVTE